MDRHCADLLECVDRLRLDANRKLTGDRKSELGQFLTPAAVARFMASLLTCQAEEVCILDAGAGVGSLFSAAVFRLCTQARRPRAIHVTAYELDEDLADYIPNTFALCREACSQAGILFSEELIRADFLDSAVNLLAPAGFRAETGPQRFNCTILSPPYKKINRGSQTWSLLRELGLETTNLYTGFLALAVLLLQPGGEMVAITPRSFCNGSYFRPFRQCFLKETALRRLHVFESRQQAFRDDEVLQENVIVHAVRKNGESPPTVVITSSSGPEDELPLSREMPADEVVRPGDPNSFIHISADDLGQEVVERMAHFATSLGDLGLTVSTGRVVDFRAKEYLRQAPGRDTAPLVWPTHFDRGYVTWPKEDSRKPNAIAIDKRVQNQLVPNEHYVLVRRFSAKEEKRRIVAAVYDAGRIAADVVGFENHLNYFHRNGGGIDLTLARGLAAYLNTTLVDAYFRQFNGHTQVNATDLRSLKYPTRELLHALGEHVTAEFPDQGRVDEILEMEVPMAKGKGIDPVKAKKRTDEALAVLKALGFPRGQQNERSALTLLSLLDLTPTKPWAKAGDPLRGITPMMEFFAEHYGKRYAPNSRETVRRQTVHQFLDAGLLLANPDDPSRPVNSGKTVYQIDQATLELLRIFGTKEWDKALRTYLTSVETLKKRYAQERQLARIPLQLPGGKQISLSPGWPKRPGRARSPVRRSRGGKHHGDKIVAVSKRKILSAVKNCAAAWVAPHRRRDCPLIQDVAVPYLLLDQLRVRKTLGTVPG